MNQTALTTTTAVPAVLSPETTSTHYFDDQPLTVILRDGEPFFIANEVATILGHRSGSDVTRLLKDRQKGTHSVRTPGGLQSVTVISEPGFYQAVLSRKPSAKAMPGMVERIERFQDWVTEEVLPSIRRTGAYALPAAPQPLPVSNVAAMYEFLRNPANAIELIGHYATENLSLKGQVEEARPAVEFVGALADSDGTWGLKAAGKALHQGPLKFVAWLRDRGDLYDLNGGPVPMEPLIKRGLFIVLWEHHGGKPRPATKLTGKGIVHYARELGVRPPQASPQGLLPGF